MLQLSPDDVAREAQRLQRNYEFLSYGLTAAWLILVAYVLMMVSRHRKLQREIASLRAMIEDRSEPRP
ncbi:MAG: CcmD family protein [Bryobacteraceae bacterium]